MKKLIFACALCLVAGSLSAENIELNNDNNDGDNMGNRTEIPITVDNNGDEVTVTSSDHVGITNVVIRNTANEVICHRVMNLRMGSVENIVLTEQQNQEKYVIELTTPDANLYGFF